MLSLEDRADGYIDFKYDMIKSRLKGLSQDELKRSTSRGLTCITSTRRRLRLRNPRMIRAAGGINLHPEVFSYYFEVDPEDVALRTPDVIFTGTPGATV